MLRVTSGFRTPPHPLFENVTLGHDPSPRVTFFCYASPTRHILHHQAVLSICTRTIVSWVPFYKTQRVHNTFPNCNNIVSHEHTFYRSAIILETQVLYSTCTSISPVYGLVRVSPSMCLTLTKVSKETTLTVFSLFGTKRVRSNGGESNTRQRVLRHFHFSRIGKIQKIVTSGNTVHHPRQRINFCVNGATKYMILCLHLSWSSKSLVQLKELIIFYHQQLNASNHRLCARAIFV